MAIDETVKSYVDKGMVASREALSKAGAASKEALTKAGGAMREFGDKSVLRIEIIQLEGKLKKTYENLGIQVYEALNSQPEAVSSAEDAVVAGCLTEIARLRSEIERRDAALKTK
ncbi:MAG: hypothetical protein LBS97_01535 [Treponema sp.]|jgi:hypothetical protein|nr:hypothetical protein [Treponema sp.]